MTAPTYPPTGRVLASRNHWNRIWTDHVAPRLDGRERLTDIVRGLPAELVPDGDYAACYQAMARRCRGEVKNHGARVMGHESRVTSQEGAP